MKSYKQFLSEAKQVGTIYHFTDPISAIGILNSDTLSGWGSTTRNKNFYRDSVKYQRRKVPTHISFELDGDKISETYKVRPYNDDPLLYKYNSPFTDEQEERLPSRVKNFKSYIKKIRIHDKTVASNKIVDKDGNETSVLDALKKHNIPIEYTP